jgi:hypothetical protein
LNLNFAKDESGLISEEKSVRGTPVPKITKYFYYSLRQRDFRIGEDICMIFVNPTGRGSPPPFFYV